MRLYGLVDFTTFCMAADDSTGMVCAFVTEDEAETYRKARITNPGRYEVSPVDLKFLTKAPDETLQ